MDFLTLALCVSTALSLLFPIIQTKESYEFGWRKAFDPYEVTWSFTTSAVWVLYSTVHLHEVTLLVLKLVALVVEACCFASVVYKFPVHNKDSLVLYLMLLSSTLPLVLIGMSIAYKSFGVGVVASALHGSLAIWKLLNVHKAFKKDYDGHLSSLHACLFASNAVIWSYYGYEKSDLLLMVPNIIVAFAGCLETAVIWLKKKEDPARKPLLS